MLPRIEFCISLHSDTICFFCHTGCTQKCRHWPQGKPMKSWSRISNPWRHGQRHTVSFNKGRVFWMSGTWTIVLRKGKTRFLLSCRKIMSTWRLRTYHRSTQRFFGFRTFGRVVHSRCLAFKLKILLFLRNGNACDVKLAFSLSFICLFISDLSDWSGHDCEADPSALGCFCLACACFGCKQAFSMDLVWALIANS